MAQYIDKDALVAEIEKRERRLDIDSSHGIGAMVELECLKAIINTLEVKEVDLEKYARHYLLHEHLSPLNNILHQADLKTEMQYHKDIETAFKAGFELGLSTEINNIYRY